MRSMASHVPFASELPAYSDSSVAEILPVSSFVKDLKAPVSTEFSGWDSVNSIIDNYVNSDFWLANSLSSKHEVVASQRVSGHI